MNHIAAVIQQYAGAIWFAYFLIAAAIDRRSERRIQREIERGMQ